MEKNQKLLDKALALLPDLNEQEVKVARTVEFSKENNEIRMKETADYRTLRLKKGDRVVLDFGDHQVGYLTLCLGSVGSHADAPAWLRIHFAEQPVELFENVQNYQGWICSSWIEEEQIHVDVIPSTVHLERRYAFRYVEIEVIDLSSKYALTIEEAVCTAVSSADESALLTYETEDPKAKKLDAIACRTLHNCMQRVFEDGPKRDRRLWMGDFRLQALANYQTYQNNDLVKACLYLFAALPMEQGQVGACLFLEPEPEVDDTVMFDYSLFYIVTLLDYYEATGDAETLRELWPTARQQIVIAEGKLDENDLVKDSDVLGWCFTDWNLALNKQVSAQGIFLYAVNAGIKIAQILGDVMEEERLSALYLNLKKAANRVWWDEEQKCYVSGEARQVSYASQVWMVLGEAIEGEAARKLLDRTEKMENALKMVTPYMYHNYIDALIKVGEKQKAHAKLMEYWGQMADAGADTFWELFNPDDPTESPYGGTIVNSYCHAWSCAPAYFLRRFYR
jgi:hypothetical protein